MWLALLLVLRPAIRVVHGTFGSRCWSVPLLWSSASFSFGWAGPALPGTASCACIVPTARAVVIVLGGGLSLPPPPRQVASVVVCLLIVAYGMLAVHLRPPRPWWRVAPTLVPTLR